MKLFKLNKLALISLSILLLACLIFLFPLFQPGLPKTDDGSLMVLRATGFDESFMDGHLPVRWIQRLNENYGYPVMNFLYPAPFYLAQVFQIVGISALNAIKIVFGLSTIVGTLGIYYWLKHRFSNTNALIASLTYLTHPYFLHDLYSRGSVGEIMAIGLIPLVFLCLDKLITTQRLIYLLLTAILWSIVIPSHNSLGLLFSGIIVIYWFTINLPINKKSILQIASIGTISLLLSAWFWLPALVDLSATRSSSIQISQVTNHFKDLKPTILLFGLVSLFSVVLGLWQDPKNKTLHVIGLIFGVILFLQTAASLVVWNIFSLDSLIQFPVRFLSIVTVLTPFLVAFVLKNLKSSSHKLSYYLFLGFLILNFGNSLKTIPQVENQIYPEAFFQTNFDSTTNQKEFTPKAVRVDPTTYATAAVVIDGREDGYTITESVHKTQETYVQVSLEDEILLTFNTHYFPGWQVLVDDQLVDPVIDEYGRPKVKLSAPDRRDTSRTVRLVWQEPWYRQLANKFSLISAFAFLAGISYSLTKKNLPQTLGLISLALICLNLSLAVITRIPELTTTFDPNLLEQKYLNSQWVNPDSKAPLGDHGLYLWAGWSYLQGTNPTLINPEMPPLGKYLIGSLVLLTNRPGLVGLFFSLTFLAGLYLLSNQVLKNKYLAFVPLALITTEVIFQSPIAYTMLDTIQLTFLTLGFYWFIKSEKNYRYLVPASLCFGGVLSTKFYISGLLVLISVVGFLLVTKRFRHLLFSLFSFSLAGLVHVFSYTRYFLLGHSFREYLGVQKWIFNFYQNSGIDVPFGSYWNLVFFNRWRVWWGPSFGVYYTLTTKEWSLLWPINALVVPAIVIFNLKYLKKLNQVPMYFVLLSWLLVYGAFLSLIGGWPHYMLLFLPFSSILLVKLIKELLSRYWKLFKPVEKYLAKINL